MNNKALVEACLRYVLIELINGGDEPALDLEAILHNVEVGVFGNLGSEEIIEKIDEKVQEIRAKIGVSE